MARDAARRRRLRGIVEDDAEGMAMTRAEPADAVAEIDAVDTACPLHGARVDREHDSVALRERDHHCPRLHAGPLLGHHELAALENAALGNTALGNTALGNTARL